MTGKEILDLPMDPSTNDAEAGTIRDYLKALLRVVWTKGEGFSGKRPFGNSGWDLEVCETLVRHEVVKGTLDTDGYIISVDIAAVDENVMLAIEAL